jgi:hypothetical protein
MLHDQCKQPLSTEHICLHINHTHLSHFQFIIRYLFFRAGHNLWKGLKRMPAKQWEIKYKQKRTMHFILSNLCKRFWRHGTRLCSHFSRPLISASNFWMGLVSRLISNVILLFYRSVCYICMYVKSYVKFSLGRNV